MKKIYTIAFMLLIGVVANAQVFVDSTLNYICKQALVEGTSSFVSDIDYMGAIILETNTGNIIANVSVGYDNNKNVVDIPYGNNKPVHVRTDGSIHYLTMMDYLMPNFAVDAAGGIRGCLAIALFPCHNPQYAVEVFVNKHGMPAGRIIPTKIVGNIINYMVEQYYKNKKVSDVMSSGEHKQERLRPYER